MIFCFLQFQSFEIGHPQIIGRIRSILKLKVKKAKNVKT